MAVPGLIMASSLVLQNTISLSTNLSYASSNFHPQGIGYDPVANELLYVQQSSQRIDLTDMNGNYLGSVSTGYNYTTSVASDGTYYYFSDYQGNTGGLDLFRIAKTGGSVTSISTETAAYGGYPLDVRGGKIYRGNFSTSYDYSMINQIRVANISAPDTILNTINITSPYGIADFAIDLDSNSIWVLDYTSSASIRRYALTGGTALETWSLGVDGTCAGLTYANGKLYYYSWVSGSGSQLKIYQTNVGSVPEPVSLILLGIGAFILGRRQRK